MKQMWRQSLSCRFQGRQPGCKTSGGASPSRGPSATLQPQPACPSHRSQSCGTAHRLWSMCFLRALDSHPLPCMSHVTHTLALQASPSLVSTLPLHTQCQQLLSVSSQPAPCLAYCLLSISRLAQALWNQWSLLSWGLKHTFTKDDWSPPESVLPWLPPQLEGAICSFLTFYNYYHSNNSLY